ncbi:MAG: hypothetical protein AB8D52_01550 [Gammaproteobacteria bacterium]
MTAISGHGQFTMTSNNYPSSSSNLNASSNSQEHSMPQPQNLSASLQEVINDPAGASSQVESILGNQTSISTEDMMKLFEEIQKVTEKIVHRLSSLDMNPGSHSDFGASGEDAVVAVGHSTEGTPAQDVLVEVDPGLEVAVDPDLEVATIDNGAKADKSSLGE